jgi:hypothetical protein
MKDVTLTNVHYNRKKFKNDGHIFQENVRINLSPYLDLNNLKIQNNYPPIIAIDGVDYNSNGVYKLLKEYEDNIFTKIINEIINEIVIKIQDETFIKSLIINGSTKSLMSLIYILIVFVIPK